MVQQPRTRLATGTVAGTVEHRATISDRRLQPITVRQLLAMPELGDAVLYAGHRGLDHIVEDVIVGRKSLIDGRGVRGRVLVLDGVDAHRESYRVDQAIRQMADDHGSAIVLAGAPAAPGIASTRLANQLGVPLVSAPDDNVFELAHLVRELAMAPAVRSALRLRDALSAVDAPTGSTLDDVVQRLHRAVRAPLALVGQTRAPLHGDSIDLDHVVLSDRAQTVTGEPTSIVVQPVQLAAGERPSLWVVCAVDDASRDELASTAEMLRLAGWAIGARLVSDRVRYERDARFRLGVLTQIIASSDLPEPQLMESLGTLGWNLTGWITGWHITAIGDIDPLGVLALTADLQRLITGAGIVGPLVERPDGWTGWFHEPDEPLAGAIHQATSGLRRAVGMLAEQVTSVRFGIGVGRAGQGLSGLRATLGEANEASTIALATRESVSLQHFDRLGVKRILLGWYGSDVFADFADTLLKPVLQADTRGELLQTLEAYLDHRCSPTTTAAVLGIHRNTVVQRIERIRSLISADLERPDERLAIQLACRVMRLGEGGSVP